MKLSQMNFCLKSHLKEQTAICGSFRELRIKNVWNYFKFIYKATLKVNINFFNVVLVFCRRNFNKTLSQLILIWLDKKDENRLAKKAKVNFKIYDVTVWISNNYNICIVQYLISKCNQTMKLGHLIEYYMRNVFLEKSYTKCVGEPSPRLFYKKSKLSIYLDQQPGLL